MTIVEVIGKLIDEVGNGGILWFKCKECGFALALDSTKAKSFMCLDCGRRVPVEDFTKINHPPELYGSWVSFYGQKVFKDRYDILMRDGSIIKQVIPGDGYFTAINAYALGQQTAQRVYQFDDVLMVRLVPDDELVEKFVFRGVERLYRNRKQGNYVERRDVETVNGISWVNW